ncbi:MAG: transcription termination factor NusA [Lachnospiraceae bacterium]|nr:transcription termination factor NusA [Lachnospiraceae bacterium]MEE3460699.1 transcription termination factor NusA [Lachnospiraceae bacterium]
MPAKKTKKNSKTDGENLIEALNAIEKEMHISKDIMIPAIEESIKLACKKQFSRNDNIEVEIDDKTGEMNVYADRTVVSDEDYAEEMRENDVKDESVTISLSQARDEYSKIAEVGDIVRVRVIPKDFGRIAAQNAKQTIVQAIRQEERKILYNYYSEKEHEIITGVVQRYNGRNIAINLGKLDTVLTESEQVRGEHYRPTDHIRLYVVDVKETPRDPKVIVSRSRAEFVKRLFEEEVTEIQDGIVEIMSIAREAGSRTKMAVYTDNPNVDPVGACIGVNGARINAVVKELHGEKIDIIVWNDDPEILIENALSPATVVSVKADPEEKTAEVLVPESQLSLAIGKEGQNARLAAKLTGYKIDIRCS